AELRFEVGEVTKTDVAQADARLAQSRAQLAASQAQLAISRAVYAELVGNAPGTLDASSPLPELPESLDTALALANDYSPTVIAAREQEDAAKKQVSIAKGAFLPSISATAQYQYADQPSSFVDRDETFSYGVRASVPIFLGGLNLSRVREARALHDSAIESVSEAERTAERTTTAAYQQLIAARQTIESAKTQVSANELALTGVRREAQLGTRTTLDVLDAEQEFLNAKVSLSNAERNERVAAFALLAAVGVLNPDALGIDASRLIPEGED
ncbi:MAG: TolC family protein, partial [Amphiplicatus sp.]|nr:TolC family protein [Amphiplicatus sp.]